MTWICCEHGEHDGSECTHCVAAEREQYAEEVARLERELAEAEAAALRWEQRCHELQDRLDESEQRIAVLEQLANPEAYLR